MISDQQKEREEENEETWKAIKVKKEMGTEEDGTETEGTGTDQSQPITADQTDIYRELILRHLIADISATCAKLGLSTDLAAWNGDDCRRWVAEMCTQFQLSIPKEGAFMMDGRRLLVLSVEEFQERFPDGGDTLHAQLQLWKTAFESCGQPIGGAAGINGGQFRPIGISMEEQSANCWMSPTPNSSCVDFVSPSSACSPIASSSSSAHHFPHVTSNQNHPHFYNTNANSTPSFGPQGHANANKAHHQQHNPTQCRQIFRHHSQLRCSADFVSSSSSSLYSPPDDLSSVADDDLLCSSSVSSSSASSSSADVPPHRLLPHHPQNTFFPSSTQNFLLNSSNALSQHNNQQQQIVAPFCHFMDQQQPTMAHHFQSHQQNHQQQQQQQFQQIRRAHQQQQNAVALAALHQTQQMQQQRVVCGHGSGGTIHLWHFIRELLDQPRDYGGCVRWVDRKEGTFKIESSHHLARFWGLRKNRAAMNYDKLSRSLRQYYKKGIIQKPEKKQRLVYKFLPPYNQ